MARLIVSCGDPSGIGPAMAVEVLNAPQAASWDVALTGPPDLWRASGLRLSGRRHLIGRQHGETRRGAPCPAGARIQTDALLQALEVMDDRGADALVTLPVNKAQLQAAGAPYAGHTEWFRARYPSAELVMTFRSSERWVALATDHIALTEVSERLTPERIVASAHALHRASSKPVAICGLNPHAGEQGMLGTEELGWEHALDQLRKLGVPYRGFLPADGLFARWRCDEAILALYHDQGLAPFKALTANRACQISLGLPFVRTSPDHGTAYDLAQNGEGDPGSTRIAFETALSLAQPSA